MFVRSQFWFVAVLLALVLFAGMPWWVALILYVFRTETMALSVLLGAVLAGQQQGVLGVLTEPDPEPLLHVVKDVDGEAS